MQRLANACHSVHRLRGISSACLGELVSFGFGSSLCLSDGVAQKLPVTIATFPLVKVDIANLSDRWIFHTCRILTDLDVFTALMALFRLQHCRLPATRLISMKNNMAGIMRKLHQGRPAVSCMVRPTSKKC